MHHFDTSSLFLILKASKILIHKKTYKISLLCLNIIKDGFVHSGKSAIPGFLKNAYLSSVLEYGH